MKKKNLPIFEHIEITGVAAEGKALVRINDIVTFVPNCVPGDIVDLQITKKKHSFMEAKVLRLVQQSKVRCAARCAHFGVCGGCKWQILPYEEQLKYKQQQIVDSLTRIGKIELPEISPILGSKHIYEYRNKLEFTCADRKWFPWEVIEAAGGLDKVDSSYGLGFHIPNCFDKVLDITECHLMPDINNRIRNGVREFARTHGLTFYNEHTHEGQVRTLILRNNHKGELMLIVAFGEPVTDACMELLEWLHQEFSEIISLLYVENTKFNDTIGDLDVKTYFGQDYIIEEMEGLQFKVGPKSLQTGQHIAVLCKLHLGFGIGRLCPHGKDVKNETRSVKYFDFKFFLDVAYLLGRQFVIKDDHTHRSLVVFLLFDVCFNLVKLSFSYIGDRTRTCHPLRKALHGYGTGRVSQEFQFVKIFFCFCFVLFFCDKSHENRGFGFRFGDDKLFHSVRYSYIMMQRYLFYRK